MGSALTTWKYAQASEVGTSHLDTGRHCDDSCIAAVWDAEGIGEVLLAFVSDGAGSASHSAYGANLACEQALTEAKALLSAAGQAPPASTQIASFVKKVQAEVAQAAEDKGLRPRDLACTFIGALVTPQWSCFVQIGDGGAVFEDEGGFHLAHWPDSGEYANQTRFLTDSDALDHLMLRIEAGCPRSVVLFSDGVQVLVLDYQKRAPVAGFFGPITKEFRLISEDRLDQYEYQLQALLRSEKVNKKTDDDKTLVVCVRG